MNTTEALRHLLKVVRAMDAERDDEKPSEAAYQLAMARADRALAEADGKLFPVHVDETLPPGEARFYQGGKLVGRITDIGASEPFTLPSGAKVDPREPWAFIDRSRV